VGHLYRGVTHRQQTVPGESRQDVGDDGVRANIELRDLHAPSRNDVALADPGEPEEDPTGHLPPRIGQLLIRRLGQAGHRAPHPSRSLVRIHAEPSVLAGLPQLDQRC
jgi:hypothetical protein